MSSALRRMYAEIGLKTLVNSPADAKTLCLQRLVRLFAYGGSTLVLVLFLTQLGNSKSRIGLFMTLTLLGDVLISLVLTVLADGIGRRKILGVGSILMTASGVIFATCSNYWVLVAASVLGVVSPSGNEIGPFKAIEESTISHLIPLQERSGLLAWYYLIGAIGAAAGSLLGGQMIEELHVKRHWAVVDAFRMIFWAYAFMGLLKFILSLFLSERCEQVPETSTGTNRNGETRLLLEGHNHNEQNSRTGVRGLIPSVSTKSRPIIFKLCVLFAIDSIGSGFAPNSWMMYFFNQKFGLSEKSLGILFMVTNLLSSASNLVASSIANHIGLVNAMVLTHISSSVALIFIPLPSRLAAAMTLLIIQASTYNMNVAPRQAFLAAVVLPKERTAVMGLVNVVSTLSQSVGPSATGALVGSGHFWIAFVIAGSLKTSYDVLMMVMFLGVKVGEEVEQEE